MDSYPFFKSLNLFNFLLLQKVVWGFEDETYALMRDEFKVAIFSKNEILNQDQMQKISYVTLDTAIKSIYGGKETVINASPSVSVFTSM